MKKVSKTIQEIIDLEPGKPLSKVQYVEAIKKLSGLNPGGVIHDRDLNVTIARDQYGRPSSAILAFVGSPTRLEVYIQLTYCSVIVVDDKPFKLGRTAKAYNKFWNLRSFLLDFLIRNSYLTESECDSLGYSLNSWQWALLS